MCYVKIRSAGLYTRSTAFNILLQHVCVCEQQVSSSEQKVVVVSVSPQSRASLAAHYSLSSSEVARRLTSFLKSLGEIESTFHTTRQRHPPVCIEICILVFQVSIMCLTPASVAHLAC